jgi:hypothetical protein
MCELHLDKGRGGHVGMKLMKMTIRSGLLACLPVFIDRAGLFLKDSFCTKLIIFMVRKDENLEYNLLS